MSDLLSKNPEYRRLNACWRPFIGSYSYWLASDHILVVEVFGTLERYRQIRLEDIVAILVRPVRTRLVAGLILGIPILVLLLIAAGLGAAGLLSREDGSGWIVGAGIVTCLLACLIPPFLFVVVGGPWCETRLVTGVQELRLSGLFRLPKAQAFAREVGQAARARQPADATTPIPSGLEPGSAPATPSQPPSGPGAEQASETPPAP